MEDIKTLTALREYIEFNFGISSNVNTFDGGQMVTLVAYNGASQSFSFYWDEDIVDGIRRIVSRYNQTASFRGSI